MPEEYKEKNGDLPKDQVREGVGAIEVKFTRSSGKGGQNVNTRSTRTQLFVEIIDPDLLARLRERYRGSVTKDGRLIVSSETQRQQGQNRDVAYAKLDAMLVEARTEGKERIPTKPKKSAKEKRMQTKRQRGEVKKLRKPPREW